MQAFANVSIPPVLKTSKNGNAYWELRAAESQGKEDREPTWYTIRLFAKEDPQLAKGDFINVVGKLKADAYMSRDAKPQASLLIMAFKIEKVAKAADSRVARTKGTQAEPKQEAVSPMVAPTAATSEGADFPAIDMSLLN